MNNDSQKQYNVLDSKFIKYRHYKVLDDKYS